MIDVFSVISMDRCEISIFDWVPSSAGSRLQVIMARLWLEEWDYLSRQQDRDVTLAPG